MTEKEVFINIIKRLNLKNQQNFNADFLFLCKKEWNLGIELLFDEKGDLIDIGISN